MLNVANFLPSVITFTIKPTDLASPCPFEVIFIEEIQTGVNFEVVDISKRHDMQRLQISASSTCWCDTKNFVDISIMH